MLCFLDFRDMYYNECWVSDWLRVYRELGEFACSLVLFVSVCVCVFVDVHVCVSFVCVCVCVFVYPPGPVEPWGGLVLARSGTRSFRRVWTRVVRVWRSSLHPLHQRLDRQTEGRKLNLMFRHFHHADDVVLKCVNTLSSFWNVRICCFSSLFY